MNEPTWSTELPQVSGWYWCRWRDSPPEVVMFDGVNIYHTGSVDVDWISEAQGDYRWSGPIEPPGRETE